jgi:hypothetical protein
MNKLRKQSAFQVKPFFLLALSSSLVLLAMACGKRDASTGNPVPTPVVCPPGTVLDFALNACVPVHLPTNTPTQLYSIVNVSDAAEYNKYLKENLGCDFNPYEYYGGWGWYKNFGASTCAPYSGNPEIVIDSQTALIAPNTQVSVTITPARSGVPKNRVMLAYPIANNSAIELRENLGGGMSYLTVRIKSPSLAADNSEIEVLYKNRLILRGTLSRRL